MSIVCLLSHKHVAVRVTVFALLIPHFNNKLVTFSNVKLTFKNSDSPVFSFVFFVSALVIMSSISALDLFTNLWLFVCIGYLI